MADSGEYLREPLDAEIDDYYEPFDFDYDHLKSAPDMQAFPTARPRSKITGERMEKIEKGPNWEEILGGEFAKRSADTTSTRCRRTSTANMKTPS